MPTSGIDKIKFKVIEAVLVGREDEVIPAGMKKRRPTHRSHTRDLMLVRAVAIHDPNLRPILRLIESPPANPPAVRTEERPAIIATHVRQALHFRAVLAHRVNIHEPGALFLEMLLIFGREGFRVSMAVAGKNDPLAIRTHRALGIVALGVREIHQLRSIQLRLPKIVILIVIPSVTLLLASRAVFQFSLLLVQCRRIGMGRGKHHMLPIRKEPATGRLPLTR